MKRLNITLPEDIAKEIKDIPNKSSFITQAIKEKIERVNKEQLDRLLIEGYQAKREEDKEIDEEWERTNLSL